VSTQTNSAARRKQLKAKNHPPAQISLMSFHIPKRAKNHHFHTLGMLTRNILQNFRMYISKNLHNCNKIKYHITKNRNISRDDCNPTRENKWKVATRLIPQSPVVPVYGISEFKYYNQNIEYIQWKKDFILQPNNLWFTLGTCLYAIVVDRGLLLAVSNRILN